MDHNDTDSVSDHEGGASRIGEKFLVRSWFIPLEDPLNLPQGYVLMIPEDRSIFERVKYNQAAHPQFQMHKSIISLKIWHTSAGVAALHERISVAFDACRKAFPSYFNEVDRRPEQQIESVATVVETNISIYDENPEEAEYTRLFDEAITHIQVLQRVHGYVTGKPVRPLTSQTLPPYLPHATASIDEHGLHTTGTIGLYALFDNIWQIPFRQDFDDMEMATFSSFLHRSDGAFSGFLASGGEARSALLHRGDARSSVLASATACEVFLDDFLKHLLWEKGRRPEDCVQIFLAGGNLSTTLSRTRRHLGSLVGGNWNDQTEDVLKRWQTDIAYVRHRTIHAGYSPSTTEATRAIEATGGLQEYASRVLLARLNNFPITALMLVGEWQLHARGRLTAGVRDAIATDNGSEWNAQFMRWRACLSRLVDCEIQPPILNEADAWTVAVIDGPNQLRFVHHHREAGLAANATPLEELPTVRRLRELAAITPSGSMPFSVAFDENVPTALAEDWIAEHRRVPLCGVMANGADFY